MWCPLDWLEIKTFELLKMLKYVKNGWDPVVRPKDFEQW